MLCSLQNGLLALGDRAARWTLAALVLVTLAVLGMPGFALAGVTGTLSAQTGEVRDLVAVDATTMYAATQGGGLWKSTNAGATWSKVASLPARYVWKVTFAAAAPNTLYVATSIGLFVSTNGGANWTQRSFDAVRAVAVAAAGSPLLIGVPGAGIYRSNDGGATFADVSAGLDSADARAIVFDAAGNAYAGLFSNSSGNWGGVFRLALGATSWLSWNAAGAGGANALGHRYVTGLAINASVLLAATADGTGSGVGKVFRNTLAGAGWNSPPDANAGAIYDIESVALDRSDGSGHSFLAGTRAFGVWRSTDDGQTWVQKSSGPAGSEVLQTTIAIGTLPGSPNAVIAQSGAGLFYTTSIGSQPATWQSAGGLAADRVLSVTNHASVAPATYYMGLQGAGVRKSTNAGGAWTRLLAGFSTGGPEPLLGSAVAVAAHPTDASAVSVALRATGLYSLSGGATWVRDTGAPSALSPQDLQFDGAGASLFYSMFNPGGGVWKRSGGTWTQVVPGAWAGSVGANRIFQSSAGPLFVMMFDDLPQRSASGAPGTWSPVNIAAAANDYGFMRIAFAAISEKPGSAGAVLVAATNRGLYRSGDGGQNWYRATISGPAAMHSVFSAVQYGAASSPLWAADRSGGLYCSGNDGDSWVAAGQANAAIVTLRYQNGQLLALTDGGGIATVGASCP
ncbi:MAG: hypothetical protein ABI593_11840 [Betaproteobacteria bacterium]